LFSVAAIALFCGAAFAATPYKLTTTAPGGDDTFVIALTRIMHEGALGVLMRRSSRDRPVFRAAQAI